MSTADGKDAFVNVNGTLKYAPIKSVSKKDATFFAGKGLMHKGISLMPEGKKGFFVHHEKLKKGVESHLINVSKWNGKFSFRKAATWYPIASACK